jgi:outer membrane protein OmpA-like peptidoglycan-associated protein/tetratricopeptide (TPR) repeat protein
MNPETTNRKSLNFLPIFLLLIFLVGSYNVKGQKVEKILTKASQLYQEEQYEKAARQYLKVVRLDDYYEEAYIQLARCYVHLEQYDEADIYFSQVFSHSSNVDPPYFLEYGQLLMIMNRTNEARSYFNSYNNLIERNDLRVLRYIKSIEDMEKYYLDSAFVQIQLLPVSSDGEDQNPVVYSDQLVFETNRDFIKSSPSDNSLYSQSLSDITKSNPDKISGAQAQKNTSYGFAIAQSTGELYRSVIDEKISPEQIILLRSFIEDNGKQVSKGEQVIIEGWTDNIAYPAVNSTGETLIFASDSKKAVGGWDLFISYRGSYGYSTPVPIPGFINTLGNEKYPYLLHDSILFFASDGHGGLGGYDMYYINLNTITEIPKNLGYPINSRFNEYGLALGPDYSTGYISSDRTPGNTLSDLYRFQVDRIRALGVVTDKHTGENVKNVAVEISKKDDEPSHLILADNGHFDIVGIPGEEYKVTVWREGYTLESYNVITSEGKFIGVYEMDIGKFPIEPTDEIIPSPIPETIAMEAEEETVEPLPPAPVKKPRTDMVFRLQIAAARSPLSEAEISKKYKGTKDVFMFEEEGWYKYAIGEYPSFFEANRDRKNCGVKDAFIAAYKQGGQKVTLKAAIEVVHVQPAIHSSEGYTESPGREIVDKKTVYFPFDLYEPSANELAKIRVIADQLKSDQSLKVEIDGHSDSQGSSDYNFGLSEARAEYIKQSLIDQGIEADRMRVISFGEIRAEQPCQGDCPPAVHRANRRAEIILFH